MSVSKEQEFRLQVEQQLEENESIQWQSSPYPKFSIPLLEVGGYYDPMMGPTSRFGLVLGGTFLFCYHFYVTANWFGFILTILMSLITIVAPVILKHKRKVNTKYALTNQRLFFQLWRFGKKRIHSLPLTDIQKISCTVYKDRSGILYFIPKKSVDFITQDFKTGKKRFYPTFEMIPEVEKLYIEIEKLRREAGVINP